MQQELFEIGKALSRIADVMEANQKGAEVVSPSASPNTERVQSFDLNKLAKVFVDKKVCCSMAEARRLAMTAHIS